MSGFYRRAGVSDAKDIFKKESISADYVDTHKGSSFFKLDLSSDPIDYTPPDLGPEYEGVIKAFKNSVGLASINKFEFLGTVLGDPTPKIVTDFGFYAVRWNGVAWERYLEQRNLWDYNELTNSLEAKTPFVFFANAIKSGEPAETIENTYDDFENAESNVDDDGTSLGNSVSVTDLASGLDSGNYTTTTNAGSGVSETFFDNDSENIAGGGAGTCYNGADFEVDLGSVQNFDTMKVNGYENGTPDGNGNDCTFFGKVNSGDAWTEICEFHVPGNVAGYHNTGGFTGNPSSFSFPQQSFRYVRCTIGTLRNNATTKLAIDIGLASYATSSNTAEAGFTDSGDLVAKLNAYDENGVKISDETKVLVEYTTDGGSTWSTQETLASFNAGETISSDGVFDVRFAAVGAQRISKIEKESPSGYLTASKSGFSYEENGQKQFEYTKQNGVSVEGVSINARLDTIENNPTQEVADITARDALTPADKEIVKVLDAGSGVTKVYKWDAGGAQWNDITDLSQANLVQVQDRISALENVPTEEVADITARDALTPVLNQVITVLDAGSGDPETQKWNGSSWVDITNISGGIALATANAAQADATQALDDAATADAKAVAAQGDATQALSDAADAQADATQAIADAAAAQATADAAGGGGTYHYPIFDTDAFTQGSTSSVSEAKVHDDLNLFDHDSMLKVDVFMEIVGTTRRFLIKGTLYFANKESLNNGHCEKYGHLDCYVSDKVSSEWQLKEHCILEANAGWATYTNTISFNEFYVVSPSDNGPTASGHILTSITAKLKDVSSEMFLEMTVNYDTLTNSGSEDSQMKLKSHAEQL